jgi:hypothetical protein
MHPGGFDEDARQRHHRVALGVAVSLALHALLLSGYRARPTQDQTPEPRTIEVRLRAPPPPPSPAVEEPPPQTAAARPAPARHRNPRPAPAAKLPVPAAPGPGQAAMPAQQEVVEQAKPHFDPEAARAFARRIANERDPARADTAVGQFPEKPYQTESKAARAISSAHRRNCKDGLPGGLLGPLFLLFDKKDSGCKW